MAKKNKKNTKDESGNRLIATNRKARHEYHIERVYEAGVALRGTEVKSLRQGHASLVDSYASPEGGEIWVHDMHIPPYEQGNRFNVDSKRMRKLLLHRSEINKIIGTVSQTGYTLIPLRLYFNARNRVKLELGVCRGKKAYDKRQTIKERDLDRDRDREIRDYRRD